jgi:hypothetical protein
MQLTQAVIPYAFGDGPIRGLPGSEFMAFGTFGFQFAFFYESGYQVYKRGYK